MNDQNRYEEVPQKESFGKKFLKGLKAFGRYWKFVFFDFFNSFKYNNMKLAAILFALPGLFLGFFMFAHVPTLRHVISTYSKVVEGSNVNIKAVFNDETADVDNDYVFTLDSYTYNGKEYKNLILTKDVISKDTVGINQAEYAIDGYAENGETDQLATPEITVVQVSEDPNNFTLTVSNNSDLAENTASYSVFVYQNVDGVDYQISTATRTGQFIGDEGTATVHITNLDKGTYKFAVKAIAKTNSGFYSSKLSEKVVVETSDAGSSYTDADYSEGSLKFIKVAGDYTLVKIGDVDFVGDDVITTLKLHINLNGSSKFIINGKDVNTRLYDNTGGNYTSRQTETIHVIPFDFSGPALFILTLIGFLSVFISLDLNKKKNLGSVVKAALCTGVILLAGGLFIYSIFATEGALKSGFENEVYTTMFDKNCIVSMSVIIASMVFSLAGLILAFINYDRTYEKVDR